jgi:hypothetical protein
VPSNTIVEEQSRVAFGAFQPGQGFHPVEKNFGRETVLSADGGSFDRP